MIFISRVGGTKKIKMPSVAIHGRQTSEFEAGLVYRANPRTARDYTERPS